MLKSLMLLFVFQFLGDIVSRGLNLPLPGSVLGMVFLVAALRARWVRLNDVSPAADVLAGNLAFLFVPPGVGLMLYFDLVATQWVPIVVSLVLSTLAVMAVVGLLQQRLERS